VFKFKSEAEAYDFEQANPPDQTVQCTYLDVGGVRCPTRNRSFSWDAYNEAVADKQWKDGYFQRAGKKWKDGNRKKRPSEEVPEINSEDTNLDHHACLRLLGLSPNFSQSELKKAYRESVKMNHPDKVAALAVEFKELAERRTKQINQAYSKLLRK
jgi:hypothetical protein